MWIRVRSALHRLRRRSQKRLGRTSHFTPHFGNFDTDRLCRTRGSSLQKEDEHPTSSTPSPRRQTLLSSVQDKQACESSDGARKDIELDPSGGEKAEETQRDNEEAEADDEEEEPDGDSVKHNTPLPRPARKRRLSATGEKLLLERSTKRRRSSSALSSDEEIETWDESDTTNGQPRTAVIYFSTHKDRSPPFPFSSSFPFPSLSRLDRLAQLSAPPFPFCDCSLRPRPVPVTQATQLQQSMSASMTLSQQFSHHDCDL